MQLRHWLKKAIRSRTSSTSRSGKARPIFSAPANFIKPSACSGQWAKNRVSPCSSGLRLSGSIAACSRGSQSLGASLLIRLNMPLQSANGGNGHDRFHCRCQELAN